MDSWKRFDETFLSDKEAFYSSLNMEDITDVDYRHEKIVFKYYNNKNIGDNYDFMFIVIPYYLQMYFRSMCLKIYELDPAHFLSAPGVAWEACLKKTEII